MKYLILGSSGQVGHHLSKVLIQHNHQVIPFDIVNSLEEDLRISNNILLDEKVKECDFIFFLAFDIGGASYMKKYQNTFEFISNNTKIMANVFSIINKYNKPFIFASSQMSNMSYSTYGILKSIGERYTESLGGLIIKFWNVYGYENNKEKFHVISDFISMAKKDGVIQMKTDGKESRQFLHGDDAAECLIILSNQYNNIKRSLPLHITNFKWTSIYQIAEIIQKISGCKIIKGEEIDTLQLNKKNPPNPYILNFWEPKIILKKGIKELYDKYK
jgi:nucleoside-diphosphate-sugar epimerase